MPDEGAAAQAGNGKMTEGGKPPAIDVGYIEIQPQKIAVTSELPGRVKAFRVAEIRPQVSGIIQSRMFKEGSFIEEGQQLYQIDAARYEADYDIAKANLQTARAELKNADSLSKRYQRLIDANAVSAQEFDNAKSAADQARARVALAEAELKNAKINLDYTKVYAPITGYIGPSGVTEGALVTAQQADPLAVIRQLDPVYIDISQAAADVQDLQQRLAKARMSEDANSKYDVYLMMGEEGEVYPHVGSLDATDLAVDEQTGTIRLRSVFANPNTVLLPGMFVRTSLQEAGDTKSIIVPQKSVIIEANQTKSVWVINAENQAEKRSVVTGAPYQNNWVITNGIESGDRVVVEGIINLSEGAEVKPSMLENLEALPKSKNMTHASGQNGDS